MGRRIAQREIDQEQRRRLAGNRQPAQVGQGAQPHPARRRPTAWRKAPCHVRVRAPIVTSLMRRGSGLEHGADVAQPSEALIPYLLLVAALAGGLLWHESENVPGLGRTVITGQAEVGGPFRLTDQNGKPRDRAAIFAAAIMLIYFGYSFCPDVCPTTLAVMAEALDKLGAEARTASCPSSSPSIRSATRPRCWPNI